MARIPDISQVGFPEPPRQPYVRPIYGDSGTGIAEGVVEAGSQLERSGQEQYAQQVNLARAQASNALLDRELQVKGIQQQIGDDVNAGKLPWNQASQAYQDQVSKLETPGIANLDPVGQENLENGLKRLSIGGALGVQAIARAGQRQAFVDQFTEAQDKLGKLAGLPGADIDGINQQLAAYRPMALAAGVAANVVDTQIQNFQDRNWYNQAEQRAITARGNAAALTELSTDLTDPKGFYAGKLDADKRTALTRLVSNFQVTLQNRDLLQQNKREAKATQWMNQTDEQISSGIPLTPAQWQAGAALTKGTSQEPGYRQALKDEQTTQQVLRMPVDQQLAYVQKQAQSLEQDGGTLQQRADFLRLRSAVKQNVTLMQTSPIQWGAERDGTQVTPINWSALSTPAGQQQIGQELSDRMTTLAALQKQYGPAIQTRPLLPQEAAAVSDQLDTAPAAQRVTLLANLHDAIGNDAAYQAVLRQIAPHSPVTAIVGGLVGHAAPKNTPLWYDPQFAPHLGNADLILHGEQLLNPSTNGKAAGAGEEGGKGAIRGFPMPPDMGIAGLRTAFGTAAGDMFQGRPQLADAYYSVFLDAYASLLAQKGDLRGVGDPTLQKQALHIALGNQAKFNGGTYSVPWGMDPSHFQGLVENAVALTAKTSGAPADWADRIRGYQLRELGGLGSGRYMLVNGNAPLMLPPSYGNTSEDSGLSPQQIFARNSAFAKSAPRGGYLTKLSAPKEAQFESWAKQHGVEVDNSPTADYDMRGFWQALQSGDPRAKSAIDPNDGKLHYPDYWKTPYDATFSDQSKWATDGAPRWNGSQLVTPDGQVVWNDKAPHGGLPAHSPGPFIINLRNQYLASQGGTLPPAAAPTFSLPSNPLLYAK